MRVAIVLSQLGDLARYVTHDPRLFPASSPPRPHDRSRSDEFSTYGHSIIQIIAVAIERQVTSQELVSGLESALRAIEKKDWGDARSAQRPPEVAVPGVAEGIAWHYGNERPTREQRVVVIASHLQAAADLPDDVLAIVTEQGTTESHAAHMARDRQIPCVVGYIGALEYFPEGALIRVEAPSMGPPKIDLVPSAS
jgi:phosphohistidine swiveling domain-containing protein